jgi:preprotein translocase subunit SecY
VAGSDLSERPARELFRRFLITFLLGVVVYRLGCYVPIPGVSAESLSNLVKDADGGALSAILRYADMFSGGAIQNASIFGLGVTPYISASIIVQLLTFSIPAIKALQKEGEGGRRKINQYTRYLTLLICVVQASIAATALSRYTVDLPGGGTTSLLQPGVDPAFFIIQAVLVITTGSMAILWIAEQVTRFGVGNGVSIVIAIGILSYLPGSVAGGNIDLAFILGMVVVVLILIAAIIVVVQAVRRVNLEQQRRVQGNKVYGGAQTTLPLKLNQANVIPVIFASPVMIVLALLPTAYLIGPALTAVGFDSFVAHGSVGYRYIFALLIIFFTFFYISITFDLKEMSNHFKTSGFFIRGIKPGQNTVDHLATILKRITFVGAVFLAVIAILPEVIGSAVGAVGSNLLMGGTGLLIVVGVTIDVMQKVATYFLAHQYRALGDGADRKPSGGKRF